MYNSATCLNLIHAYRGIIISTGLGENGLAKGAVINQLIMEHSKTMPTTSTTILAESIDHALKEAGYESHLRADYEQNLLAKENKQPGKQLHQFLAEQGIPTDTVKKVAALEAEGFRQLLKQLEAKYRLLDKSSNHTQSKERDAKVY